MPKPQETDTGTGNNSGTSTSTETEASSNKIEIITYEVKAKTLPIYKTTIRETKYQNGNIEKGKKFSAVAIKGKKNWYKMTNTGARGYYVYLTKSNVKQISTSSTEGNTDDDGNATDDQTQQGIDTSSGTGTEEVVAQTDENGNPIDTSTDDLGVPEDFYMEDALLDEYNNDMGDSGYLNDLENGISVKDIRGILGMPHQFMTIADYRIDGTDDNYSFGRVYSEKILRNMPLLLITPGVPSFMAGFNDDQKQSLLERLFGLSGVDEESLPLQLGNEYAGKYYSLRFAYVDYFEYVNAMLRSAAVFLNLTDVKIDGTSLGEYNWLYGTGEENIFGSTGLRKFLGPYAGCIALYADCGNTISDNFGNDTTQSQLSSTLNSLSDTGRELNFLVGNVGSVAGLNLTALTGQGDLEDNIENVQNEIDKLLGHGNIMSNILGKAQTILAGGRLIFPEIWSDSSFGRSYSCSMKLISPSGDKFSIYMNILVPIYHILAMALPRQSIQQAYFSPFLLRCYYKGLFNIDMGIMTSLTINKGAEGEWTVDGLPTVADISFDIKDLYSGMFMSRMHDNASMDIISNITELDYIANSCGININDQEVSRTAKLYTILRYNIKGRLQDWVTSGIFGNLTQYFNQRMNNLFGMFK